MAKSESQPLVFEIYEILSIPFVSLGSVTPILWFVFVLFHTDHITKKKSSWLKRIILLYMAWVSIGLLGRLELLGYLSINNTVFKIIEGTRAIGVIFIAMGAVGYGTAKLYTSSSEHDTSDLKAIAAVCLTPLLYIIDKNYAFLNPSSSVEVLVLARIFILVVGSGAIFIVTRCLGVLDDLPATSAVGRELAIESISNIVFVVSPDGNITSINSAAQELLDQHTQLTGRSIDEILPVMESTTDIMETDGAEVNILDDNRIFRVDINEITDYQSRNLGYIVNLQDITNIRRSQQRISVLNRVLRHNLRNDLNAASGFAELAVSKDDPESQRYLSRHQDQLDSLVEKGSKARDIEEIMNRDPKSEDKYDLVKVIREVIQEKGHLDGTNIQFNDRDSPVLINANPAVLSSVVEECIQNSINHNPGGVDIQVSVSDRGQIKISDSGRGIPDHELVVLDSEEETDLEHGSGLGLWLIRWGMDHIGGSVDIDTSDSGTTVTLLPPSTTSS